MPKNFDTNLFGRQVTISLPNNNKMVISRTRDDYVSFWPHKETVELNINELKDIISNLFSDEEILVIRNRVEMNKIMEEPHGNI